MCGPARSTVSTSSSPTGRLKDVMEHRFPVILGKDIAGSVETVGAGVNDLAPGDNVFGVVVKAYLGDGGLSEWVATPTAYLAEVQRASTCRRRRRSAWQGRLQPTRSTPWPRGLTKRFWSPGPPAVSEQSPCSS